MNLIVEREDVWVASMEDKPGALANRLAALADAGADLDFIIARRAPDKPGTGLLFVTPLRGDAEVSAAAEMGFRITSRLHSVRVDGENQKGIAAKITEKVGAAGINLRGFSGAVIGTRFVMHLSVDTKEAADKMIKILQRM